MSPITKIASVMLLAVMPGMSGNADTSAPVSSGYNPAFADTTVLKAGQNTEPVTDAWKEMSKKDKAEAINSSIPSLVKSYFSNHPQLMEIAECESNLRQYDSTGNVLRGRKVASDIGLLQINEYYHKAQADKLGFDIHTLEGNIKYGIWLYEREGSQPWSASRPCWINK